MAAVPRVLVIGTGGTIAGAGDSATTAAYEAGRIEASQLVAGVPGIERVADVRAETLFAKASGELGPAEWRVLARRASEALDGGEADGIVVTHGTDTLEEAAFFLDLVCRTDKPVVFVGAMRAATALGSDGPANLYQAVRVAVAPGAARRGVLVAMNDLVLPGRLAIKTGSLPVQTFEAFPGGPLGRVTGERLTWFEPPHRAALSGRFRDLLDADGDLPPVGIAYLHGGCGTAPLVACRDAGYAGVVIAGFGAGTMPKATADLAREMVQAGTAIAVSSRVQGVTVLPETTDLRDRTDTVAAAGFLNPQKAAHLLSLALAAGLKGREIPDLFGLFPDGANQPYGDLLNN